jgi:digeranylgeranylglycerophospholipid reductase
MEEKSDGKKVAIVGGGITGLYLAWRLREKGIKVTVFEKKEHIGTKPCSALISERIKNFLPITESNYLRKVESVLVHLPKKEVYISPRPPFLLFERDILDNFVFDLAKNSGVEFVFGKKAIFPIQGFSKVIACDGALSQAREFLSLPKPEFRLAVQFFTAEKSESLEIEIWPKFFKSKPRHGFLWKIPRKEKTEYGGIGHSTEIKKELENFLKQRGIDLNQGKWAAHLVPQGIVLPHRQDITLIGDSAGMAKPTTGGGIIWGLTAADILLKNFPDFLNYKKEAERFFRSKQTKGRLMVSLGYPLGEKISFLFPRKMSIDADLF